MTSAEMHREQAAPPPAASVHTQKLSSLNALAGKISPQNGGEADSRCDK